MWWNVFDKKLQKGKKDEKRPSFQLVLASDTGFFKPFPIVIFLQLFPEWIAEECHDDGGFLEARFHRGKLCADLLDAGMLAGLGFLFFVDWSTPQNLSMFVGQARPS